MIKLVSLIPSAAKIWIILGLVTVVLAVAAFLYKKTYDSGWNAHVVVAEAEKLALRQANEKAIREAEKTLKSQLVLVRLENERLENENERLNQEGDADPAASVGGISADSVRRIEAIR